MEKTRERILYRALWSLVLWGMVSQFTTNAAKYVGFEEYTVEDGMKSEKVCEITQDTYGHIWVTTGMGVSRFDGKLFKNFDVEHYPTMKRNDLGHLKAYKEGAVFFGGVQGALVKYDPQRDVFVDCAPNDFKDTYYKVIEGFSETRNGVVVANTSNGIYFYDDEKGRFANETPFANSFKDIYVLSFYEDKWNRYWVSSFNKLYIANKEGEIVYEFDLAKGISSMFSSKIHPVNDSLVLVSCFSDVLCEFSIKNDGDIEQSEQAKLPFSNLGSMVVDEKGHFWYATDGFGLWYSDSLPHKGTKFEQVRTLTEQSESMEKIYHLFHSCDSRIWMGTKSAGLWSFSPYEMPHVLLSSEFRFPNREVTGFCELDDGRIYLSSDGGGLVSFFVDSTLRGGYADIEEVKSKNILSIEKDNDGVLWLATWGGGVIAYDTRSGTCRRETFDGLNSNLSCYVHYDRMADGEVWVSTGGDGIYMKEKDGNWKRWLLCFGENEYDMWPKKVVGGKNGVKWISTSRTVWRVSGDKSEPMLRDFSRMEEAQSMAVYDIAVNDEGDAYIATTKGIMRITNEGGKVDTLTFLPSCVYYALLFDSAGRLRASSDEGLFLINEKKNEYKRFDYSHKIPYSFKSQSVYELRDGRVIWGTKTGFIIQNQVKNDCEEPLKMRITDVNVSELSGEESSKYLKFGENGEISSIELPYKLSELSLSVDWVDYGSEANNLYFRLKGLSDKWSTLPTNRRVKFTYIPSGAYELQIIVERNGKNREKLILPITVLSPWWRTWWFILLMILLGLGLVSLGFLWRLRIMRRRQRELKRLVEERTMELDQKNELIQSQNEELKIVLSDKDRLISVIAHDLKNPMFAIVGALEGWVRREKEMDEAEKRETIVKVLSSANVLQEEMGRLLEWVRAKSNKIDYTPSDVDLKSVVDNVVSLMSSMSLKKNIQVGVDFRLSHYAWVDSRMMSTIVRNFVSNAIKFTNENGHIRISGSEDVDSDTINMTIADDGVGMSDKTLNELRNQGFSESTLGTQNEKGTGLGFRICQDYIMQNKGTMEIESSPSKGTKITISVPSSLKQLSTQSDITAEEMRKMEVTIDKEILRGNTVVVVDDDELIVQNVGNMLRPYMDVITASNGEEALKVISENDVDIILSDVEMPVMNGIELSRRLSYEDKTNCIPFLFLSARNEQSDRLIGLLSGAVDYISKPFSEGELIMKVNNILRLRQKQQNRILQKYYQQQNQNATGGDISETPQMESNSEEKKKDRLNPFLSKLMGEIETKYTDSQLSIVSLSSALGMSQSTLSRRTNTLLGKTPVEILNEYRLAKAYELLKDGQGEQNISEVAYMVGFSDPVYFSRKFKILYGILPSSMK